ncbi:MAG TPA: heme-binding protein [Xanthobacteraceae bacterium]|nr:heme-binding protein [Xanthobacteraceae bacterium]
MYAQTAPPNCPVDHDQLVQALKQNVHASGGPDNGGMPVNEWAAVVDRFGNVCAVAFSGAKATDQWLGSRAIAIEKANTVVSFSLDTFALSTANLWAQSQPGGYLFGAAASNPPVPQELYAGEPSQYGTTSDPLVGKHPGGVIAFGGGLALYDKGHLVGGLGASGNTPCADHNIAWRVRQKLGLNKVPDGPTSEHNDAIVYDVAADGKSKSGWGHPTCGHNAPDVAKQIGAGIVMSQLNQPPARPDGQLGQPMPPPHAQAPRQNDRHGRRTLPRWQR